jgi:beta-galactosidase
MVLPSVISLSDSNCETLRAYVKEGGVLIADCRLNIVNEWGEVRPERLPGKTLADVFGLTEKDVAAPGTFTWDGEEMNEMFMSQILDVDSDTQILASNENGPVVTLNNFGKGKAYYFATSAGLLFNDGVTDKQQCFLKDIVLSVAPDAPWAEKSEFIHVSFHESKEEFAIYVVNLSDSDEKMGVRNVENVSRYVDIVDGTAVDDISSIILKPFQFKIIIGKKDANHE